MTGLVRHLIVDEDRLDESTRTAWTICRRFRPGPTVPTAQPTNLAVAQLIKLWSESESAENKLPLSPRDQ